MNWSTACVDWEERIVNGQTLTPCKPLFPTAAAEGWRVYSSFKMVDAGGSSPEDFPTFGDLSDAWTREFVEAIFGCYCNEHGHPKEGKRLIKEFFMLISKKNGKSTVAAGIGLTMLLLNWRHDAEFIILAPTKEVAGNSFDPIVAAINADEELSDLLHVQPHLKLITHRLTNAKLKVLAADAGAVTGKKATFVLVDELHEFGKSPKAVEILNEVTGGLISRPEGCVLYLTTQSSKPPAGVFKSKLDYARKVRDGVIHDPGFYPIIYEFPKHMVDSKAYMLPENYYVTNPNMGRSVDEDYLARKLKTAQADPDPSQLADVLCKHLNIQIGINLTSESWKGAAFWGTAPLTTARSLEELCAQCEVVVAGVDGGGLDDLYGLHVLGRKTGTADQYISWEHAIAHPHVLELHQEDVAPRLRDFEAQGDVTITDAIGHDASVVVEIMVALENSGLLFAIGFDPNSLGGLLSDLVDAGIPEEKLLRVATGFRLAAAIKTCERWVAGGQIEHAHRPLMDWCVSNARVELRGNAIVITKMKSGTAKIDPVMAMFNSVDIMATNPPAQRVALDFTRMEPV